MSPVVLPQRIELGGEQSALLTLPTGLLTDWSSRGADVVVSDGASPAPEEAKKGDRDRVVSFLNGVSDPREIVRLVRDDPDRHPQRRGYGVRPSLARAIVARRDELGGYSSIHQVDQIRGVGEDTLHDLVTSLRRRAVSAFRLTGLTPRLIVFAGAARVGAMPLVKGHRARFGRLELKALAWRITVGAVVGDVTSAFLRLGVRQLGSPADTFVPRHRAFAPGHSKGAS